jgi:hypothetical protein
MIDELTKDFRQRITEGNASRQDALVLLSFVDDYARKLDKLRAALGPSKFDEILIKPKED